MRDDLRALWIGQTNLAPWQKGGGRLDPREFFGHLFEPRQQQTAEEMVEMAKLITLAHGGEIIPCPTKKT